ncbi:MAG: ATP-dependent zinc protease [Coxiellaceae bacterium]|nr:ATP-dependent zinc protease [Coxiellaceae bacterium]
MHTKTIGNKLLLGRDVWCQLPDLRLPMIKAKIDTGAKTSSLHAFNIERKKKNNKEFVTFDIHPLQRDDTLVITCSAPLIDGRRVMSSNGHIEYRYVIETTLVIAHESWTIEITLSNRDPLRYRFLLGREALKNRIVIDPSLHCHQKLAQKKKIEQLYQQLSNT